MQVDCGGFACAVFFFSNDRATPDIYTLSLHDALPILGVIDVADVADVGSRLLSALAQLIIAVARSEEHTSELQSRRDLVCRLLLEKKNQKICPAPLPHLTQLSS